MNPADSITGSNILGGIANAFSGLFGGNKKTTPLPAVPKFDPSTYNPYGFGVINQGPKVPAVTVDYAKQSADLQAQINNLTAALSAQPRLPSYDILGNYTKAKQQATSNVTPLYEQKLQQFLDQQAVQTANKQAGANLGFENNAIANTNTLFDNDVSRNRVGEDLISALTQIATNRQQFLQDDGNQFDTARRALQGEVAAAGGTDTGIGQQQIETQKTQRNTQAGRQLDVLKGQEEAKKLITDRSIQDLATGDLRSKEQKTQADKGVQLDLDSYLNELPGITDTFKLQNELDKSLDIATQTGDISKQLVNEWINSLAGSGARAQDIALAKQVYG